MKKTITLIFLFQMLTVFAQDAAFTNEVVTKNGLLYFSNKPFTGILFSLQDGVPNSCDCTLKAVYSNGKLNGLKEEWYTSGQKKFKGSYIQGKKNKTHISWDSKGVKKLEQTYLTGKIIESKQYFSTGNLQFQKKYSASNFNEKLYEKTMYENNKIKEETHFKDNQLLEYKKYYSNGNLQSHIKHDSSKLSEKIYEELLFVDGKTHKKIKYHKGNPVEKNIYNEDGFIKESLLPTNDLDYFENIHYFENEKIKLKGYFSKTFKKDSLWTTFDKQGNKLQEQSYLLGKLVREGKYKDNQKDGIWKQYMQDGITQKNTVYQSGNEIESYTLNTNHLFSNNYTKTDDVALFEFVKINGEKENIAITSDTPFAKDIINKRILGTIAVKFLERMRMLQGSEINENTVLSKKVHITNMSVKYTSNKAQNHLTKEYFKTYDAYISFHLMLTDVEGKKITSRSYNFNKSQKILNILLNATVQTYATNKSKAFNSALKSIEFRKLFKKHFPIDKKSKR